MMSVVEFFSQPVWHRLGLTLVHFLWQGVVVATIACAAVRVLRLKHGNPCYATFLLALVAMAVCPLITFLVLRTPVESTAITPGPTSTVESARRVPSSMASELPQPLNEDPVTVSPTHRAPLGERLDGMAQAALPWALACWMGGVVVLSLRLLLGFIGVCRWRRGLEPLAEDLQTRVARLSERLGLPGFARVFVSPRALEVVALGYLRPMVLLPATLVTQMPPEMLEAIIAHELAHIRRLDLWVNLAQRVVETLLFYHPAVWWLSSRLRSERELCCDELAVQATGERLTYASALEIAGRTQWAARQPVLALGLGQDKRSTLGRIRHVLGLPPSPPASRFWLAGIITVALLALLAMPAVSVLTAKAGAQVATDGAGADRVFANPTNLGPSVNSPDEEYDPSISADELELYFNSLRSGSPDIWVTTRKTKADLWGEPANLGPTVNGPAGDKTPSISGDGLSLHFSSDRPGGHGAHDLWVTTRKTKSDPWGAPVNLGPTVNSPTDELAPSLSTDGLELYFSGHPSFPEAAQPGGSGESDLWVTTRKTTRDSWGTPVNLGPTVNSPVADASPSISGDGLSLYFNSDRPGGSGGDGVRAIWVTQRKSTNDAWGTPVKLGLAVNTVFEGNPEISKDGSTLYFSSRRPGGLGGADIWQATMAKSTPESRAQAQLAASLHAAVEAGDIEQVRSLLSKGAGINATDIQGQTPLHGAAANGRRDIVQLLLEKGANVDATDAAGRTALHQACASASDHALELLLAKGAKMSARDNQGNTPLHVAARNQETGPGFLESLLAKGAEVNARNQQGQTPLHLVSMIRRQDKHRELPADALVAHGAEVDATDKTGRTPLHVAAQNGQPRIVELLLTKGAVDKKTNDGLLALHSAVLGGHKDVVVLLLSQPVDKRPNINAARPSGETPLHDAAKAGYNEIIERLIGKRADVNARNARGETAAQLALAQDPPGTVRLLKAKGAEACTIQLAAYLGNLAEVKGYIEKGTGFDAQDGSGLTALHAAAASGQGEVAEFLLGAGAAVNAVSGPEGLGTPLHYAVHGGSKEVAELLLLKGGLVDAQNNRGETPLHLAAQMGHTDLCRLLINGKADVKLRTRNAWTPLHYAAASGQKAAAAILVEKGASIDPKDRFGQTPLNVAASQLGKADEAEAAWETDMAASQGHRDVMRFLIDKGADVSSADLLYNVVWGGEKELTELLIKKGANVNAVSGSWGGYPVSLYACWGGNPAVLELLLAHGTNPNADDGGWSLLHYEVGADIRTVTMLLDKGANPNNTVDLGGQSPLHRAAELGRKAHVELLVARGADPNIKDYEGRTPLSLAKAKGHNEIVEFLQQHGAKE